jgi:hypothetical protein
MDLLYVDQSTLNKAKNSVHTNTAQLLIKHGAQMDRQYGDGLNALHLTCNIAARKESE